MDCSMADDFREIPIPTPAAFATTRGYRKIEVNLNDMRSHERLVDIAEHKIASNSHYARKDGQNAPYYRSFVAATDRVYLRRGVAERLALANGTLRTYGVELLALDGYRPLALQNELWNYFIDEAKRTLNFPTETECVAFAEQFCSDPRRFDPKNSTTWPVHCTGGSIDVTLRSLTTGSELFMGSIFDDGAEASHTSYFEQVDDPSASSIEARRNRRLLYWALHKAELVNYPYEWWHFDYLNQMWAMNVINPESKPCYGPAYLPDPRES
jgi:zinc D-Ala-D-Ala dipeptidase